MDQLNMNNIKHHEKINTHTQRTKNNTIQRAGLFFFSKWQYVRHGVATRLLKISCFEKITVCVIETMLLTLSLVQMNTTQSEVNQPTKHRSI